MKYDVMGLGNALLDYQVEVPENFLSHRPVGQKPITKGSMTLVDSATQHQLIDEIILKFGLTAIRRTSGGCAANTLAGIASYGGSGFFVGKVSTDDHGHIYEKDLLHCGLSASLNPGTSDATGTCLALITPDAERTMLTHLGISTQIRAADVKEEYIEQSQIVYIEGYLWDPPSGREASQKAIAVAKAKKRKVAFTFADSFCVGRHFDDFVNLAKTQIDLLFCNEAEALQATKTSNVEEAFKILKEWAPAVCITIGPKGALVSNRETNEAYQIPTWDVPLVDKLGAGDLFAAGVLFGLTHNFGIKEAAMLGNFSATRVIQQMSARLEGKLERDIGEALGGPTGVPAEQLSLHLRVVAN